MSKNKTPLPNTFKGIHEEFHQIDPTRPKTATEAVNAAYQRGADKIEKLTGKRPNLPPFVNPKTQKSL
jgi:hypothetical protein